MPPSADETINQEEVRSRSEDTAERQQKQKRSKKSKKAQSKISSLEDTDLSSTPPRDTLS